MINLKYKSLPPIFKHRSFIFTFVTAYKKINPLVRSIFNSVPMYRINAHDILNVTRIEMFSSFSIILKRLLYSSLLFTLLRLISVLFLLFDSLHTFGINFINNTRLFLMNEESGSVVEIAIA